MKRHVNQLIVGLLSVLLVLVNAPRTFAAAPTATNVSVSVSAVGATAIQLQGGDGDGTALVFAVVASPAHGTISNLNSATGALIYTPTNGYVGTDSFTFHVTSGGDTSSPATVSLTVTNAKTRIIDSVVNADGSAMRGKVTFLLTQAATSPAGLISPTSSVSAVLNSSGQFSVSVYPSTSLSPQSFYQVYYEPSSGAGRQLLGLYSIPASTLTLTLAPYKVTDANLSARYVFASESSVQSLAQNAAAAAVAELGDSPTFSGTVTAGHFAGDGALLTNVPVPPLPSSPNFSGTVTATAFIGNGAGITGLTGATGGVANSGSTTIGADTDANTVGVIDLQIGLATKARLNNNGTFEAMSGLKLSGGPLDMTGMTSGAMTATNSTGQSLTQIDAPTGSAFPAYVGFLFDTTPNAGAQFGAVFKITTGTATFASRPAGHQGVYKAALYAECRTIAGNSSDAPCYGSNFVAEGNSGHLGFVWGSEIDVNNNIESKGTDYKTQSTDSKFVGGLHISTGGVYNANVAVQLYSGHTQSKFHWGYTADVDAYDHVGVGVGDLTHLSSGLAGEIVVAQVNSRPAVLVQQSAGATGDAFRLRNNANTIDLARIAINGDVMSTTKIYNIGGEGFQLWKDGTPSQAWNMGMMTPGDSIGDTLKFSFFNGTAWVNAAELTSTYFSLGGAAAISYGSGAPSGTCGAGIYIRTGMGTSVPGLYVCQNSTWVAK